MRTALTALVWLAAATPASADRMTLGAAVGGRASSLGGQVERRWAARAAISGIVNFDLSNSWSVGIEPGIRWSGSSRYRLVYAAIPVVGHLRYPLGMGWRARGTLGTMPGWLVAASYLFESDGSQLSTDIRDHVRTWDLSVIAGLGLERRSAHGDWWFVEARVARGLATIDPDNPALFIVNQELGLWVGLVR